MNPVNQIFIAESARGYRVRFPYKPSPDAIRGFHQIGLIWQKQFGGDVYYSIPADRLNAALDVIGYWYTEKPIPGQPPYGVRVAEPEEMEVAE